MPLLFLTRYLFPQTVVLAQIRSLRQGQQIAFKQAVSDQVGALLLERKISTFSVWSIGIWSLCQGQQLAVKQAVSAQVGALLLQRKISMLSVQKIGMSAKINSLVFGRPPQLR